MSQVFKYRKCTDYAISALFNSEMSFVCPSILNDPIDCNIVYKTEIVYDLVLKNKIFQRKLIKFLRGLSKIENGKVIFPNEKIPEADLIEYILDKESKKEILNNIDYFCKQVIEDFRNSFLILSLSKTGGHPVMWSHYADDSKGFMLEFNRDSIERSFYDANETEIKAFPKEALKIFKIHNVIYDVPYDFSYFISLCLCSNFRDRGLLNKYIRIAIKNDCIDTLIRLLTLKAIPWSYEKECRMIFPRFKTSAKRIPRTVISDFTNPYCNYYIGNPTGIILGANISYRDASSICFYAKENNIPVMKQYWNENIYNNLMSTLKVDLDDFFTKQNFSYRNKSH